jgi:hypothetical protein
MTTYIYESPDKGKTVYKREFCTSDKILVKSGTQQTPTTQDQINVAIMLAKISAGEMY